MLLRDRYHLAAFERKCHVSVYTTFGPSQPGDDVVRIPLFLCRRGPAPRGLRKLDVFDYCGVTLDGGRLRLQLDEVRDYYLRIPNDDLLKGFRQRAKKPAPGKDLGGWYSSDTFHVFGQILSGLARLYAASGDTACKEKVDALVSEWGKCIAADGYFYYSAKPNAPHYIYDKMVGGLVDAYLYCGNREALGHLRRITDWAVKNLERSRRTADTGTEWYTLSENLDRAYLATGDSVYRDFAEVWEYREYWDIYARKADLFAPRPSGQRNDAYHAYSHVNTLGGAAAAYLVKGDRRYLDILINAYDSLQANQIFATGGYGPDEQFLPCDRLRERLENTANTFETQCGAWAGFKMAKHLLCATGEAKYGDWVERLVLNGIGASIPMSARRPGLLLLQLQSTRWRKAEYRFRLVVLHRHASPGGGRLLRSCLLQGPREPLREPLHALHGALVGPRHARHAASDHAISRGAVDAVHGRSRAAGVLRPEDSLSRLACRARQGENQRGGGRHRKRFAELGGDPAHVEPRRPGGRRAADASDNEFSCRLPLSRGNSVWSGRRSREVALLPIARHRARRNGAGDLATDFADGRSGRQN